MPFVVNDRVEVRSDPSLIWRHGTVTHVPGDEGCPTGCYAVELDTPATGNNWSGVARKHGGLALTGGSSNPIFIRAHVEQLAPGEYMKAEGA